MALNTRTSIVDYLKSQNQDASFNNRATLAKQHGISNYTGSARQNTQLLSTLRGAGASQPRATSNKVNTTKTNTVQQTSAQPKAQTSSGLIQSTDQKLQEALNNYKNFLRGSSDAFYDEQASMIDTQKNQTLNDLKKAYDQAVKDGEMSEQEALEAFENNVGAINDDAYLNSQITELSAEQRGIGNSQQMLAMQQGDQRATQQLRDENRNARDKRINEIKDRISQITNEYNLDVEQTNTTANNALRQAKAQADQMFNTGMSNMNMMQYQNYLELKSNLTVQEQQHLNAMKQMAQQQQYTQDNMNLQHRLDLSKMKTQHGYDLEKIDVQFNNDLTKMAKQYGYDMSKLSTQHKNQLAQISAQKNAQIQAQQKAYEQERARALASVTPGTTEYKIATRQMEMANDQAMQEIYNKSLMEGLSVTMSNPNAIGRDEWYKNPKNVWKNADYFIGVNSPNYQAPSVDEMRKNLGGSGFSMSAWNGN